MKNIIIILFTSIIIAMPCKAQHDENDAANMQQRYAAALQMFNNGLFDESEKELLSISNASNGMLRSGALRLLALSALERGDDKQAGLYVSSLLKYDPYFTPGIGDPQKFIDLIDNLKYRSTTISTASQQDESIEEAPVPVTLITDDMIKAIGARTLKEVLITYVPGMTDIASNEETNLAMRGIYSSGQEKIMILLNGHRMNSYSTNVASPDFSMSLEKVKQIEVLRGPASSIYGGVALTGVVNIITKEGSDIDGTVIKFSTGNYGQVKGDILFGKKYMGLDIMAWGSIYSSSGQSIHYDAEEQHYSAAPNSGDILIGAYNRLPSYDLGTNIQFNNISFLYNRHFSKAVAPYTLSSFFAPYSYDKYLTWNGCAPGYALTSDHAKIAYQKKNDRLSWQLAVTYDHQEQQRYQIGGDVLPEYLGDYIDIFYYYKGDTMRIPFQNGGFQSVNWSERTIGGLAQFSYKYTLGGNNEGALMAGMQYNHFKLLSSSYMEGIDYDKVMKTFYEEKVLYPGEETYADTYIQLKHRFGKLFILNAGMRYDYKKRRTGKELSEFSPRVAFIWRQPDYSVKLSYSRSFVDAPYFYRSNTFDINTGTEDLNPEHLNSLQLSFLSDNKLFRNLYLDVNMFYNNATNFIVSVNEITNINAGEVSSAGVELVARYALPHCSLEGNMTWQKVLSSSDFTCEGSNFSSIPALFGNIVANVQISKGFNAHINANILSKQYMTYSSRSGDENIIVPARAVFNMGINYNWKNFTIGADVHNVFNKKYTQGGNTIVPIRQQGAWIMGNVSYKI